MRQTREHSVPSVKVDNEFFRLSFVAKHFWAKAAAQVKDLEVEKDGEGGGHISKSFSKRFHQLELANGR